MSEPLGSVVSVVIATWNAGSLLIETLESALSQTYQPIEIIVVDDGSSDGTAQVAARFAKDAHYIYQERGGIGAVVRVH